VLDALAASLEETLDAAAAARPDPGRPALHRLNRAEYANAIRDLLGLDVDVTALLPPDTAAFGFDNAADAQGSFAATTNFNESGTAEGSLAIVKFLVERGARLDIRNSKGGPRWSRCCAARSTAPRSSRSSATARRPRRHRRRSLKGLWPALRSATARLGGGGVFARPLLDRAGTCCDARRSAGRGNRAAHASLIPRWSPVASRRFVNDDRHSSNAARENPPPPVSLAVAGVCTHWRLFRMPNQNALFAAALRA